MAAALAGCVAPQIQGPADAGVDIWRAQGKLGIVAEGKGRSINFDWSNDHHNFDIRLSGALGVGAARLSKRGSTIELTTGDGRYRAASAEDLLWQTLGWSVPVSDLRYWIKGLPAPDSPVTASERDPAGSLLSLTQQGWQIDYRSDHKANDSQAEATIA